MTFTNAFCIYCSEPATRQAGKSMCEQCYYSGTIARDRQAMGETIDQFIADLGAVPKCNWCGLFIYILRRLEALDGNIDWLLSELEVEIAQRQQFGTWHVDSSL